MRFFCLLCDSSRTPRHLLVRALPSSSILIHWTPSLAHDTRFNVGVLAEINFSSSRKSWCACRSCARWFHRSCLVVQNARSARRDLIITSSTVVHSATRLSTTPRRLTSLIHFPLLMSVMICWAIGHMIASRFDRMRGICLGSIFFALIAPVRPLGLAPKGLDSSVAHRLCTRSAHDHSHTLLSNALFSSAPAFRPYHHWKSSM